MLVVGLGNPGARYELTRHNLGFMVIDRLAREADAVVKREECRALVGFAEIESRRVELVKPQTFMNLSGEAIACLLRKRTGLAVEKDLLIVVDDLALPFGTLRLRPGGSSGGHNGLKSIESSLKTSGYARLRLGIKPAHDIADVKNFVLERFPASHSQELNDLLARSVDAVRAVITNGIARAMAEFN